MRATCLFRTALVERNAEFCCGLKAVGFTVVDSIANFGPGDVVVTWNRFGASGAIATEAETAGATILVAENGWLGKNWSLDSQWFSLCIGHHGGAGHWPNGGPSRWDAFKVAMWPWRGKGERVILSQRGFGEVGIAAPEGWAYQMQRKHGGRVRSHPGKIVRGIPLVEDLKNAGEVWTWNSSAALIALMMGIPVRYEYSQWIGAQAAAHISEPELKRDDSARVAVFRRMAWALWSSDEIRSGRAFKHVLGV